MRPCLVFLVPVLMFVSMPDSKASFHLMQVYQTIGGVNGDSSAQAIELRMRFAGQNFLGGSAKLIVVDATGANPVTLINFPTNVNTGNSGSSILITSANFKNYTSNPAAFATDFTLTNPIPPADLNAGRLLYEDSGSNILWSLAFGGAAYTGPTNGETTNGPADPGKFGGPLPGNDLQALLYQGAVSGQNGANATDYALTPGAAVFTNNAGTSFTVVPEPTVWTLLLVFGMPVLLGWRWLQRSSGRCV